MVSSGSDDVPKAKGVEKKEVAPKGTFQFLGKNPDGGRIEEFEKWHKFLPMEYDDTALQYAKDLVAVNVRVAESIITEAVGSYDTKDFSIVERFDGTLVGNPKVEVWTMRAFDAHEIFFSCQIHMLCSIACTRKDAVA